MVQFIIDKIAITITIVFVTQAVHIQRHAAYISAFAQVFQNISVGIVSNGFCIGRNNIAVAPCASTYRMLVHKYQPVQLVVAITITFGGTTTNFTQAYNGITDITIEQLSSCIISSRW